MGYVPILVLREAFYETKICYVSMFWYFGCFQGLYGNKNHARSYSNWNVSKFLFKNCELCEIEIHTPNHYL